MIGWLLILSFVLGFALTWLYMVRSVSRTIEPVAVAPRGRVRTTVTQERYEAAKAAAQAPPRANRPGGSGSRVVEFDEE